MGRSSVSQRGFVSAVLTLAFVALALGLAINFLVSRNDNQETLAREKVATTFVQLGELDEVANSLNVIAQDVCVENLTYKDVGPVYETINFECEARGALACPCHNNLSAPELSSLIPSGRDGTFRLVQANNTNPNFVINQASQYSPSEKGGGPDYEKHTDETGDSCFSGDTLILVGGTANNPKYKRIDSLKVGDYVLSVDQIGPEASMIGSMSVAESMKFAALRSIKSRLKPVRIEKMHIHEPPNEGAIHLSLSSGDLVTTISHPFMIFNNGWKSLGVFANNSVLVSLNGELVRINNLERIKEPMKLYNFTLQESFTYFVLPDGALSPIWVHNAGMQGNEKFRF